MNIINTAKTRKANPLDAVLEGLNKIILGNPHANKLALVCLLARGHLLIEDIPGVGKTTLSHVLARLLGLPFKRVQFTSDLLPTDILGVMVFDTHDKTFSFKKGPIFTSFLLADEINRATPKTQSALLQAMEEYEVSVEGKNFALKQPFFVIATQNPVEQSGTFPLPESQLDRFLIRLSLGYPGEEFEKQLLSSSLDKHSVEPLMNTDELLALMNIVEQVHVSDAIVDYLWRILDATRSADYFKMGLSPRAGLQWLRAARALALVEGRDMVLPDDIKTLAPYVAAHRLTSITVSKNNAQSSVAQVVELVEQVPTP
ncbi:MAG: MoxR family ATPase [Pseudomonadota bacterium]